MDLFLYFTIILLLLTIGVPLVVFYLYCLFNLFKKCDIPGWKSLIPFYNLWTRIEFVKMNWWYFLIIIVLFIFSIGNIIGIQILSYVGILFIESLINYSFVRKVSKEKDSIVLNTLLLTFVPIVMVPIMGLSNKYKYDDDVITTPNSYIDLIQVSGNEEDLGINNVKKTKNKTTDGAKFCTECGNKLEGKNKFCPQCGHKLI